jgi:hypothetical protein
MKNYLCLPKKYFSLNLNCVNLRQFAATAFAVVLVAVVWLAAGFVLAEPRVSEDDMFGTSGSTTAATPGVTPENGATAPAGSENPAALGAKINSSASEENLQIGGTLSTEADFFIQNGVPFSSNIASNPNLLFLYLDSKLENDARVFARIRAFYDPTGISSGNPNDVTYTNPYGFGNGTSDNLQVDLQELRISANISHEFFFTIGRQKVKYGAAKFFNPTDFLNPVPYDFFLPSDERTGVDMVKLQIPSGTANLYAAGVLGNPTTGNQSGGYFRGELGYDPGSSFFGSGEISLSGWFPKNQLGRGGFDISQALGDFDVYFEGAAGQNNDGGWADAISTGASWEVKYADRDTNTVTFEGEYFQAGPLAELGVFAINLGGPGNLTDMNFIVTSLFNFNDQSGLSRLDTVCQFTSRISGRVYISAPWGTVGGSLYLPGEIATTGARMDVNF